MTQESPREYGLIAQSIAPVGMMMAVFTLTYAIWFGFAWGWIGWITFALVAGCSAYIASISLKNIRHAKQFQAHESEDGKRIGRQMGILAGVSYGSIGILTLALAFFHLEKLIFPALTLIIGLHFIPQAKIMNRKIDYLVAPFPIISALTALYLALTSDTNWLTLAALAGIGGAIATLTYGFYILKAYRLVADQYQILYP